MSRSSVYADIRARQGYPTSRGLVQVQIRVSAYESEPPSLVKFKPNDIYETVPNLDRDMAASGLQTNYPLVQHDDTARVAAQPPEHPTTAHAYMQHTANNKL